MIQEEVRDKNLTIGFTQKYVKVVTYVNQHQVKQSRKRKDVRHLSHH